MELLINIDVDDLERGIGFYETGLGMRLARTLFDLNLLRIHPKTRKVFLAEPVQSGPYARLWARPVRLPDEKEDAPGYAALLKRWDASS